jgi:hypothetical protein
MKEISCEKLVLTKPYYFININNTCSVVTQDCPFSASELMVCSSSRRSVFVAKSTNGVSGQCCVISGIHYNNN